MSHAHTLEPEEISHAHPVAPNEALQAPDIQGGPATTLAFLVGIFGAVFLSMFNVGAIVMSPEPTLAGLLMLGAWSTWLCVMAVLWVVSAAEKVHQ